MKFKLTKRTTGYNVLSELVRVLGMNNPAVKAIRRGTTPEMLTQPIKSVSKARSLFKGLGIKA